METIPQRSFLWENFSGLQPFVYLQAPILAWPTDCSDRQDSKFLRPPGRIHRAGLASLPITSSGITTCPNRTIDTTGLVMASAITHLLDRSVVGCSFTQHLIHGSIRPNSVYWSSLLSPALAPSSTNSLSRLATSILIRYSCRAFF